MTDAARSCLILANPKAGALSRYEKLARLRARLAADVGGGSPTGAEWHVPASLELLTEAAQRAGVVAAVEVTPSFDKLASRLHLAVREGVHTVAAVGGDGTARTFAQTLLQHGLSERLALGILPLGTANNVAHSLRIPFDLDGAMRVLAEGVEQRIDVGQVGNDYFLEAAGVGLFADALRGFGADEPRPWQIGRLLRVLGPLLWNLRARNLQITLDGRAEQDEALLVATANGPYLGEGIALDPAASLTDGLFNVVIVGALSRSELLVFARAVLRGAQFDLPQVRRVQAQRVEIRRIHGSHRPLPVHADDHIATYTPAVITLLPRALRVLVPPSETGSK